jgi:hypothetical protein
MNAFEILAPEEERLYFYDALWTEDGPEVYASSYDEESLLADEPSGSMFGDHDPDDPSFWFFALPSEMGA